MSIPRDSSRVQRTDQKPLDYPRVIHSMEILKLPIMALQERIEHELQENPVLELRDTDPQEYADSKEYAAQSDLPVEQPHRREGRQASRSLQDYLGGQVGLLDMDEAERELIRHLISYIDERGYLSTPLDEIAQNLGEATSLSQVEQALFKLQKLDPPGVGARNTSECLLLQLTPATPHREVVRVLIQNHLDDIAHNRLPLIQKKTGCDLHTINEAIEVLKHLELRPGSRFTAESIPYVVPDIVVERTEAGDYTVRLLDDWVPNIYISQRYLEMYRDRGSDPKAREFLKRKIQAAQWLMESIEQRRNTLEKVARAIIQHQRKFLDQGPEHIEPLNLLQIANQVGVHVTTVSRAVDDKWVQTPHGIFPLKRFFGGGTQTASGEEIGWETIKQKLLEIIGNEDKAEPLSDEDLVTKLGEAGYPVARRTVTKYRKMLKIQSSRQRSINPLEQREGDPAILHAPLSPPTASTQEAIVPSPTVVTQIGPMAYLRSVWTVIWSAFRHPLSTTLIDLSTGEAVHIHPHLKHEAS
jgi:RNA polymerase sigma-54 factor